MSTNKNKKKSGWGGYRPNSGPEKGSGTHQKICVSVNRLNWQNAKSKWNQKPSWLVDRLISHYLEMEGALQ